MASKKIKPLPSIAKDLNLDTSLPKLPLQTDISLSKYYRNISDLPLSRFIDVLVDQNIYALIITGKPSDIELLEAWSDIQIQYADAIKDNETRMLATLGKELNRLKITHQQILDAIKVLKNYYTPQFANMLNKLLSTSFKFDVRLKEDYDNDLKRAANRSKGIMIAIQLKQKAYDAMRTKFGTSDQKVTREYFQGILITLSDFVQYRVGDNIAVFEFCDRIRRLNQHNETIKNKK